MEKKIKTEVKLIITCGEATPAPPIGPSLAQHGINVVEFCNKFNEATKDKKGQKIPVVVIIYEDKTFDFVLKKPPVSALIKEYAKIEKGAHEPGREVVAELTMEDVRKIAEEKMSDLNTDDIEKAMKIVIGTAKSMGVRIIEK